jgi:hypothetical protein
VYVDAEHNNGKANLLSSFIRNVMGEAGVRHEIKGELHVKANRRCKAFSLSISASPCYTRTAFSKAAATWRCA